MFPQAGFLSPPPSISPPGREYEQILLQSHHSPLSVIYSSLTEALLLHCVSPSTINLFYFERALRLFLFFSLAPLPFIILVSISRSWKSFSRSNNLTPNLQLPRDPLILCPPKPHWSSSSYYSISYHLSSLCSGNNLLHLCNAAAVSHLSILPHSVITALTDGSVLGALGKRGAGIHVITVLNVSLPPLSLSWRTLGYQL